ncbi:MAG: hypothetical protein Q4G04_06830 [bacterium]|nr:hypothetical protein [bacterium]
MNLEDLVKMKEEVSTSELTVENAIKLKILNDIQEQLKIGCVCTISSDSADINDVDDIVNELVYLHELNYDNLCDNVIKYKFEPENQL